MPEGLSNTWFNAFMDVVKTHEAAPGLREASMKGELRTWTKLLTDVVIDTFPRVGWTGAAKGHRSKFLPVQREEYLSLDAVAFSESSVQRWRFPVGIFELENSTADDRVAYSLWKVLCVRASLRVVFCYRRDSSEGSKLVRHLSDEVVNALDLKVRSSVEGETFLVIGSRNESESFPYGFFKGWLLDRNTSKFDRI